MSFHVDHGYGADFYAVGPTLGAGTSALLDGEMCVGDIAAMLGMGQSAISHQLRLLRSSGLVRSRRDGKTVYYLLADSHVHDISSLGLEHITEKEPQA